jgi:hypothetical protein
MQLLVSTALLPFNNTAITWFEVRCKRCRKLMFKTTNATLVEIKCSRCSLSQVVTLST